MAGRTMFSEKIATAFAAAIVIIMSSGAMERVDGHRIDLCSQTAYPSLCGPLVRRLVSPRQATHHAIRILESRTKTVLTQAARYKSGNQVIAMCYGTLSDALTNLENARKSIRKRNVIAMNTFLTAAVSDYGACVDGFIEAQQVNTVQNAADMLRKMGTNCLSLSTFIR